MMRMLYSSIYSGVLIVDEVQNKSIATEIILFIAKHNLDIQLIIMSATLDPETYKKYQESRGRNMPIIEIPGRTFPIEKYYN
jgi:HrpA-like RNA helicase